MLTDLSSYTIYRKCDPFYNILICLYFDHYSRNSWIKRSLNRYLDKTDLEKLFLL